MYLSFASSCTSCYKEAELSQKWSLPLGSGHRDEDEQVCLDVSMEGELGWHRKSLAMAALPSVVLRSGTLALVASRASPKSEGRE